MRQAREKSRTDRALTSNTRSCARPALVAASVAAILAAARAVAADPVNEPTSTASTSDQLEVITVTATLRSQSLQNVPFSVKALTDESLQELHAVTFDDFAKYVPSLTSSNSGPGQSTIFLRGLATTTTTLGASGAVGSFPNVAVYLDDQPVQLPGRNLDLYAVDLERIEVLEGPQGTLFGAGAQAGAIRYITKKPVLNTTAAGADISHSYTAHGDPSTSVSAWINLPLIEDKLAVRGVFYDDTRGGYIRNVPGTFSRKPTDQGIVGYFGGVVPPLSESLSNTNLVQDAFNPTTYEGFRTSARYQVNDDWSALVQYSEQQLRTDGVFSEDSSLGDLEVQQYNQSNDRDRYSDVSLNIEGRIRELKLVYIGGFLQRNIDQTLDYTNYTRGPYVDYYQCVLPTPTSSGQCYSPSSTWHTRQHDKHISQELRLSTPDEWRLRAIGGLFWEDYKIQDTTDYAYGDPQAGFGGGELPAPGSTMIDPSARPPGVVFFNDITRGYRQKAAFLSVDFDLIPHTLTFTAGTRYYDMDTYELGSKNLGGGCRFVTTPCVPSGSTNLDTVQLADGSTGLHRTFTGFRSRFNLEWKVTDDAMVYATYSEGFRPGGFNRGQGIISSRSPLYGKFTVPYFFKPDNLINKEIGWKTQWLDNRLQFNGAVYQEDWKDAQISIFDPSLYGGTSFATNGPNYRVRGVETELTWRLGAHLSVFSSANWNSGEQTNNPSLIADNGQQVSLFPTGGKGSPLAHSPPFQGNVRMRYDLPLGTYAAFWQVGAQHSAHSYASVLTTQDLFGNPSSYNLEGYTSYDASVGVSQGPWRVELFGTNLTDKRAQLDKNFNQWVLLTTVSQPRTVGLSASYRFQ